jgi:hypothetical protein
VLRQPAFFVADCGSAGAEPWCHAGRSFIHAEAPLFGCTIEREEFGARVSVVSGRRSIAFAISKILRLRGESVNNIRDQICFSCAPETVQQALQTLRAIIEAELEAFA